MDIITGNINMGGICGALGEISDRRSVTGMLKMIKHRGPDKKGVFEDKNICMASCKQRYEKTACEHPFGRSKNDLIIAAVDGLVYNSPDLIYELNKKGFDLENCGDSEIIANLYQIYGDKSAELLEGDFAFAIWDSSAKRLVLGTDKLGSKPVFYSLLDDGLLFSSEMKSILAFPGFKKEVNFNAIYNYLIFRFIPSNYTPFKKIGTLPAATLLVSDKRGVKKRGYWKLETKTNRIGKQETIEKYKDLLKKSILSRMLKNPGAGWAISLSGGLDSSALTALSAEIMPNIRIETFSFGLDENDEELRYAKMVSEKFGTKHHEGFIGAYDDIKAFPLAVWNTEMVSCIVPNAFRGMMYDSVKNRKLVSGLGAEEVFIDKKYLAAQIIDGASKIIPFSIRKNMALMRKLPLNFEIRQGMEGFNSKNLAETCARLGSFLPEDTLKKVCSFKGRIDFQQKDYKSQDVHKEFLKSLSQRYLWGADSQSMSNAQQLVNPFIDSKLISFAHSIPINAGVLGAEKNILRLCTKDILPKEVLSRKKKWNDIIVVRMINKMTSTHKDLINEYLSRLSSRPHFKEISADKFNSHGKLCLFSLELWYEIFVDADKINRKNAETILS